MPEAAAEGNSRFDPGPFAADDRRVRLHCAATTIQLQIRPEQPIKNFQTAISIVLGGSIFVPDPADESVQAEQELRCDQAIELRGWAVPDLYINKATDRLRSLGQHIGILNPYFASFHLSIARIVAPKDFLRTAKSVAELRNHQERPIDPSRDLHAVTKL